MKFFISLTIKKDEHEMDSNGIVTSVGSIGQNFSASDNRSYWNHPNIYASAVTLGDDWQVFLSESQALGNRRALMRTFLTQEAFQHGMFRLPIEAAIPTDQGILVYMGHNQHQQVSQINNAIQRQHSEFTRYQLNQFYVDTNVTVADIPNLIQLWQQFGWNQAGVKTFVKTNRNPIVVARNQNNEIVGAMIAESLQFGKLVIVEVTEMAVLPECQGQNIAKALTQHLSQLCFCRYGQDALVYGEFNLTTSAHRSALAAGMNPGICRHIKGVLLDHVTITTGTPKKNISPWNLQYIHSYQVMFWNNPLKSKLIASSTR
jgi:ribosomal protein S18 acetylase RimI-like enzyme